MAKFHINKHGIPAPCKATKGNCPYGGDEQHFDTIEKAQEYADKENAEKYGILSYSGGRSAENVEGFNAGLEERLFSKHVSDRIFAARRGYGAEILAKDENKNVRLTLAEKGFVPDTLAQDKDPEVRERVLLTNGDKLSEASIEALSNDEKWYIRRAVAKRGQHLDKLSDDERAEVRGEVALQGHALDKLTNDDSPWVRSRVARKGHNLDKLVNDESSEVRAEVARQGYQLNKLVKDEDPEVRKAVAMQGYGLVELQHDEDPEVRKAVEYSMNPELYYEPKREQSFSLTRKYTDEVKGVEPVDYKEYAKEHNVSIPEAAKMRMKENLNVVTQDDSYSVEFENDKPVVYINYKDKSEKLKANSDGTIKNAKQTVHGERINRLIHQYYEALKVK